ncbi:MAG: hypothetical protein U0457_11510 [Candidatus Sericytochromatia bacterium]
MTIVGPSQALKNYVAEAKKATANEAQNVVNETESQNILNKVKEEMAGLNESDANAYANEAQKYLQSEFKNTNVRLDVKLSDGSKNLTQASKFTFNITGKVETKSEIPQDPKLVANGVDFNKEERGKLANDPNGKKIIQRYDNLASDKNNSIKDKTELNNASKEDLKGLKDTFGNDADKFLNALKQNPKFQTATLDDAKNILKYANEGCKNKDDVIKLQQSLKNVGPDLKERFEKNGKDLGNGKGIDGAYGFATMEGVRYLSSVMEKAEPKIENTTKDINASGEVEVKDQPPPTKNIVNWVIGCDSSSSMAPKLATYGKLFKNEEVFHKDAKYTIGKSQDLNEKVTVLSNEANSEAASKIMNNQANFKYKSGAMSESGVTQLYNMIKDKPALKEEQKPAGLMIVSDANEQNPALIDKLIKEAKDKGYAQITVAAVKGESNSGSNMINIDLNDQKSIDIFKAKARDWDTLANDPYLKGNGSSRLMDY